MAIELITGHAGTAHISSADDGALNAGTIGSGRYVLTTANEMAATMPSANTITIATGDALFDGRHVRITSAESVTIDSGTQGQTRHDIVGIEYSVAGGVESAAMTVFKGTPAASGAVDPDLPTGNILEGAASAFMPIYRVTLNGINAEEPELMANMLPNIDSIADELSTAQSDIDTLSATASYTHYIINALGSSSVPVYCRRVGSFVTLFVQASLNPPTANSIINCGTLPNGYRPPYKASQGGPSVISANIGGGLYRWTVDTAGNLTFICNATGQRECNLALTYYTSNAFPG